MIRLLKPKKMTRVVIAGPRSMRDATSNILYDQGSLHIRDYVKPSKEDVMDIGTPSDDVPKLSDMLIKLRSLRKHLDIDGVVPAKMHHASGSMADEIENIDAKVVSLLDERKEIDESLSDLWSRAELIGPVSVLGLGWDVFTDYKSISYHLGYLPRSVDLKSIKEKVYEISDESKFYSSQYEGRYVVSVFMSKEKDDELYEYLNKLGFKEIKPSCIEGFEGKPVDAMKRIDSERKKLRARRAKIDEAMRDLSKKYLSYVKDKEKKIEKKLDVGEVPLRFAESKNAFMIEGWVPEENYGKLERKISSTFGDDVYLSRRDDDNESPIALNNPKTVKPFEFLINLYSMPKYGEIDPTFFMFLTFPLFFGFMLGDLGYGILTFILFGIVRMKVQQKELKSVLSVMMFASFMTAIFGYAFGEFFGTEEILGHHLHPLIHRLHEPVQILMIALAMGVVHINIGYIIGIYNEYRAHGIVSALLEKGSWILLQLGAAAYYFIGPVAGIATILLSVAMIGKGEGVKGLLELPSILANILSYSRLMAVGIASAIIALVVNEMAGMAFSSGGIGLLLGAIVLIFGHSVAIALGILSPFIHSLRLHYVEFFMKFFHGGGKRYMPFGGGD